MGLIANIPCLELFEGFVSIRGVFDSRDPFCLFLWNTAPMGEDGDSFSLQRVGTGAPRANDYDLSLCLTTLADSRRNVIQVLTGVRKNAAGGDFNGDGIVDAADLVSTP